MFKKLFSWLFKTSNTNEEPRNEEKQSIAKLLANPGSEVIRIIRVETIHDVMLLLQEDFSQVGYEYARKIPDRHYANSVIRLIKGKLVNYCEMVITKTRKKINSQRYQNQIYKSMGLMDLVKAGENRIEQWQKEIEKLNEIRKDIETERDHGAFHQVKHSFLSGFIKGMYEETVLNTGTGQSQTVTPEEISNKENNTNNL